MVGRKLFRCVGPKLFRCVVFAQSAFISFSVYKQSLTTMEYRWKFMECPVSCVGRCPSVISYFFSKTCRNLRAMYWEVRKSMHTQA